MTKTLESLVARFKKREEFGLAKYGTTMDRKDLSGIAWAVHAQEEAMDLCLYLERVRYALALLEEAKAIIEAEDLPPAHVALKREKAWLAKYQEQFGGEE
jgi:hypothetical protein